MRLQMFLNFTAAKCCQEWLIRLIKVERYLQWLRNMIVSGALLSVFGETTHEQCITMGQRNQAMRSPKWLESFDTWLVRWLSKFRLPRNEEDELQVWISQISSKFWDEFLPIFWTIGSDWGGGKPATAWLGKKLGFFCLPPERQEYCRTRVCKAFRAIKRISLI